MMLTQMYAHLTALHADFQQAAAAGYERDATVLLDRMVELENEIFDAPVGGPEDQAIKLRLLLIELWHDLTPRQRGVLDEALFSLESQGRRTRPEQHSA